MSIGRTSLDLHLGYFKQGSDLRWNVDENDGELVPALEDHAGQLERTARDLRRIAEVIDFLDIEVGVCADTHHIHLNLPLEASRQIQDALQEDGGIIAELPPEDEGITVRDHDDGDGMPTTELTIQ